MVSLPAISRWIADIGVALMLPEATREPFRLLRGSGWIVFRSFEWKRLVKARTCEIDSKMVRDEFICRLRAVLILTQAKLRAYLVCRKWIRPSVLAALFEDTHVGNLNVITEDVRSLSYRALRNDEPGVSTLDFCYNWFVIFASATAD